MHLADPAEQLNHPGRLFSTDRSGTGQSREPLTDENRRVGDDADAGPTGKRGLQPLQGDARQHGDQQGPGAEETGLGSSRTPIRKGLPHRRQLLGLDRQKHHGS